MLLVRLFRFAEKFDMFYIAFFGVLAALLVLAPWRLNSDSSVIAQKEIFTGLMVVDGFSVLIRGLLFGFGLLFLVFTKLSGTPTDYFKRQGFASVDVDEYLAAHVIDQLGDDNLVLSTDYPHHDSSYPHATQTFLELDGVSVDSKRKILWDNCARLYGLD